jgi:hypothetical protein
MKINKFRIIRTVEEDINSFKFHNKQITSKTSNSNLFKNAKTREVKGEQKMPTTKGIWKRANTYLEPARPIEKKHKPIKLN